jgi:hypothetical protein
MPRIGNRIFSPKSSAASSQNRWIFTPINPNSARAPQVLAEVVACRPPRAVIRRCGPCLLPSEPLWIKWTTSHFLRSFSSFRTCSRTQMSHASSDECNSSLTGARAAQFTVKSPLFVF